MAYFILFLGVQLSGKTTLARQIAGIKGYSFLSIDDVRRSLYGHLTAPKDWKDDDSHVKHNEFTQLAYDELYKLIEVNLRAGFSLVVEMPHLGTREQKLQEMVNKTGAVIKVIWCYISHDGDEEIIKRIRSRPVDAAEIRLGDYKMFKSRIRKPEIIQFVEIDTFPDINQCLTKILNYLERTPAENTFRI